MRRFFAERLDDHWARLSPEDARHALTVLRMKAGDCCAVLLEGGLYAATIASVADGVTVSLGDALPSPEPRTRVTLYQGAPKGDKMDYIAQKCVECGITRIVPVMMARCVARFDARDGEKKRARWQRIGQEAAKQCGRAEVPIIEAPISFNELCARLPRHALSLAPWEEADGMSLRDAVLQSDATDIALVIGPEGGVAAEEIEQMKASGALPVTLGKLILRTETAGLAALIMTLTLRGDYQ